MQTEDLKNFIRDSVDFYTKLRVSEKERYEILVKFMTDSTNILKELAERIQNSIKKIEEKIEDQGKLLMDGVESIKNTLGTNKLEDINRILQDIIDRLQRQSYLIEYKDTIKEIKSIIQGLDQSSINVSKRINPKETHSASQISSTVQSTNIKKAKKERKSGKIKPRGSQIGGVKPKAEEESHEDEDLPTFMRIGGGKPPGAPSDQPKSKSTKPKRAFRLKSVDKSEDD